MLISGSIKELRAIMRRSVAINAKVIQFMFPNHAVAVSEKGEYVYFRTSLFISHSVLLSRSSIENLERFFKFARRQRLERPKSLFHSLAFINVAVYEDKIEFDKNSEFSFEFETGFVPADQSSDMMSRIDVLSKSSIMPQRPYLKLRPSVIDELYANMKKSVVAGIESLSRTHLNTCVVINQQLHVRRDPTMNTHKWLRDPYIEQHVFDEDFVIMRDYEDINFKIYDVDIVMFHRLAHETVVNSIVLIPFDNFYIAEAHGDELLCKFHMKIPSGKE